MQRGGMRELISGSWNGKIRLWDTRDADFGDGVPSASHGAWVCGEEDQHANLVGI